jgi:polyhydroxybutyrate depolymerase
MVVWVAACSTSKPAAVGGDAAANADGNNIDTPPAAACAGRTAQPKDADWMIDVSGTSRLAHVHVPASYDPSHPTPVVINLHGLTGNGTMQAALSHMIAKSDAAGFIAVHPEASTNPTSWNAGPGCCNPAYNDHVDDVGFMRALIDRLEADLCVDPDRVFTTGLSNGGYLSHTLACDLSDRVAAIGSVAGLLGVTSCPATRAVPVFDVHGNNDPIVSYSYVAQTIDFWTQHNKCTTETTTYTNGDATCVTHGGCTNGADVVLCTIANGGHQWPGGDELPLLGYKSDDLDATGAQWEFFLAHPR